MCFVTVDAKFSQWAESFNQHVVTADGPAAEEEDGSPEEESPAADAEETAAEDSEEEEEFAF